MLYFIVNTKSQTGKALKHWHYIKSVLEEKEINYKAYETGYEGHAKKLASHICTLDDNDKIIVAVGGDGTINEIINGITGFESVRFAVIPTGSGNDFVKGHNLPVALETALERILDHISYASYTPVDLGLVSFDNTKRYFTISSGLGLDAIVCKKALSSKLKKLLNAMGLGNLTYILLTIISLFTMKTSDFEIVYTYENGSTLNLSINKVIFAAAMNLAAEGGGVPMAPEANGTNSLLTLTCAHGISKGAAFLKLPFLAAGKHQNIKGFDIVPARKIAVHTSKPNVLHADGEYLGDVYDVHFEIMPSMLHLL